MLSCTNPDCECDCHECRSERVREACLAYVAVMPEAAMDELFEHLSEMFARHAVTTDRLPPAWDEIPEEVRE